jgi:serine/threonine protein kinase
VSDDVKLMQAKCLASFLLPMLEYQPEKRVTAGEILSHPWLDGQGDANGRHKRTSHQEGQRDSAAVKRSRYPSPHIHPQTIMFASLNKFMERDRFMACRNTRKIWVDVIGCYNIFHAVVCSRSADFKDKASKCCPFCTYFINQRLLR